jgi:hypothetical protein
MTMFGSSIDFLTQQAKDITQTNRQSIAKIATGGDAQKLAAMDRKTGNLGRVIRISTDNMSKQDSIRFFQNAISYMQFQEETILYARQLYSQMYALAQEAQSAGISADEREMLNAKFLDLRDQAIDLNNLTFNGKLLFDQFAGSVNYDVSIEGYHAGNSLPAPKVQEFVYNRGIFIIDVSPGGGADTFVMSQVDEDGEIVKEIFKAKDWVTAGGAANGDFDRFFIEWGPDQDTTFRFIPQSAGKVNEPRIIKTQDLDFSDPYFDNKARYLANLNLLDNYENFIRVDGSGEPIPDRIKKHSNPYGEGTDTGNSNPPEDWWKSWGLDNYRDHEFANEYGHLEEQNPNYKTNLEKSQKVIFDKDDLTTKPFGDITSTARPFSEVITERIDPLNTKFKFEIRDPSWQQFKYKFFFPEVKDTEVGNVGDMNTSMKPLGLGLLRLGEYKKNDDNNVVVDEMEDWKNFILNSREGSDSENAPKYSGDLPILDISTKTAAELSVKALDNELLGLTEQMGILGNNMSRVVTSMEAVDKQLGIQKDLVAAEPEKVVSQELANLAKAKEMRAFNASLMSRVVQINHDMINLLLG